MKIYQSKIDNDSVFIRALCEWTTIVEREKDSFESWFVLEIV